MVFCAYFAYIKYMHTIISWLYCTQHLNAIMIFYVIYWESISASSLCLREKNIYVFHVVQETLFYTPLQLYLPCNSPTHNQRLTSHYKYKIISKQQDIINVNITFLLLPKPSTISNTQPVQFIVVLYVHKIIQRQTRFVCYHSQEYWFFFATCDSMICTEVKSYELFLLPNKLVH